MAANKVIAGEYQGYKVEVSWGKIVFRKFLETIEISQDTVEGYEVIDNDKTIKSSGAVSKVGKGFLGATLLGPIGWLAGTGSGTKSKNDITIAVMFKNGKKSLIECDQEIYSAFMRKFF